MLTQKELWSLISFIKISRIREKIVKSLAEMPQFPSELAKGLSLNFATVSKNLRMLEEKGIIYCYNPNQTKGRLFTLSKTGEKIVSFYYKEKKVH